MTLRDIVWRRNPELASVESNDRRAVVNLARLRQAPVVLQGAAAEVFDTVDGVFSTAEVCALLAARHPHVADLDQQVEACLQHLADVGLVLPATPPEDIEGKPCTTS